MTELRQNFSLIAGDDTDVDYGIVPPPDPPFDITQANITWTAYPQVRGVADKSRAAIIKTSADGSIEIEDASTYAFVVHLTNADTVNLAGNYYYEIVIGGPSGYVAQAVHFDGNTWFDCSAITAANANFFSMSFWFKGGVDARGKNIFATDPNGSYTSYAQIMASSDQINVELFDAAGANQISLLAPLPLDGAWHHVLYTGESGQSSGSNSCVLFVDDIDASSVATDNGPFALAFNGLEFAVFSDAYSGDEVIGDFADFWISTTSLLTGGTIAVSDRRKFISAALKPVDPANFPPGFVLFSGDASTFATNKATGGVFTVSGALTNAGTSPSGSAPSGVNTRQSTPTIGTLTVIDTRDPLNVVAFKSMFPEMMTVDDGVIQTALDEAALFVGDSDPSDPDAWDPNDVQAATFYLAAHFVSTGQAGSGGRLVTSERIGQISINYATAVAAVTGGKGTATAYPSLANTSYGLMFLALMRRNSPGIAVV